MTEPFVLYQRPGPTQWRRVLLSGASVLLGAILWKLTLQRVESGMGSAAIVGIALALTFGTGLLIVGAYHCAYWPYLLQRGQAVRLDDAGLWIAMGLLQDRASASIAWDDVLRIDVQEVDLPPSLSADPVRLVLRFVPADEAAIRHDPFPAYTLAEAEMFQTTPIDVTLAFSTLPDGDKIPRILGWLRANRPALPINDLRPGAMDA